MSGSGQGLIDSRTVTLVGRYYYPDSWNLRLVRGTPAMLVRNPKNKVDPCDVEVYVNGTMVGHVARVYAGCLSSLMDNMPPEVHLTGELGGVCGDPGLMVHPDMDIIVSLWG
ncbi:hypothetical protein I4F81_002878 [Pyropia yezoensis]|uniref:Uncharacterized protein n=1 Tax=Pyropia yezoensis TaxID=2788 RepID=A0ACC3BRH8_PYRYE|nr:hypothetical protein I4F81_002878 [Neopyropia yezoensis]